METWWQDTRFALRMLMKNPGFSTVAVVVLALGIGANAAIFTVVHSVLLKPLPYPEPERIVWIWDTQRALDRAPMSAPEFLDYQSQNQTMEQVAGFRQMGFNLTGDGTPERVRAAVVTANFFAMLRVGAALGRTFQPEEGVAGAPRVALLSHGFWQRRFGGDAGAVGKTLRVGGDAVTVIGVLPENFSFLDASDLWLNAKYGVPEVFAASSTDPRQSRGMHYMNAVARLKQGVTLEQARADFNALVERLRPLHPDQADHGAEVVSFHERLTGWHRPALLALLVAVGLVLLIACVNVANLLLSRAARRQRELAIRAALGANRGRLVRQMLTESVLLALLGGMAGILLGYWGARLLVRMSPEEMPRLGEIGLDATVLEFSLAVSLLTGLLFGLAPALQAGRRALHESRKEGGRSAGAGRAGNRVRSALVIAEVALSLVLLSGAGLLLRSFQRLLEVEPGFRADNLVVMHLNFAHPKYNQPEAAPLLVQQLLERLEAAPGIEAVALAQDLPLEGQDTTTSYDATAVPVLQPGERALVGVHTVNPGYFRAMGIPLRRGREFAPQDARGAAQVVIVNQAVADRFWPGQDPIGRQLEWNAQRQVVGVVGNVLHNGLNQPQSLDIYLPFAQAPWPYAALAIRTTMDTGAVASLVRTELAALDPELPVHGVNRFVDYASRLLAPRRLTLALSGLFAALAVTLAAVGLYGVISYTVSQRTHELGVRMALGARPRDVLRLVIGQGAKLALAGVAIGVAGALAVTRLMKGLLFGVTPTDPLTLLSVALGMTAVALAASWIPARRAARTDPVIALRYE